MVHVISRASYFGALVLASFAIQVTRTRSFFVGITSGFYEADNVHLIFVGDSLTRYQFLALAYRALGVGIQTPDYMVSERMFKDWHTFYVNTTTELRSCVCDCFRTSEALTIDDAFVTARENRHCKRGGADLSYFQLFGDTFSMHGGQLPNETQYSSIASVFERDVWRYENVSDFFLNYARKLVPPPTAIVLNAGLWSHERILRELPAVLSAASVAGSRVFWKETSPRLSELQAAKAERPDVFTRDVPLLAQYHLLSRRLAIDETAYKLCRIGKCTYIPFPKFIPIDLLAGDELGYWDDVHFSSGRVYDYWNDHVVAAIESALHRKIPNFR